MSDMQNEVLQRITRVEEKVNNMDEKLDRAIMANDTAVEALHQGKSAHKRIDDLQQMIKDIKGDKQWLWRTIAGAFLAAAVAFVVGGGLK